MIGTFVLAGIVSFFVGKVKFPPCILGAEGKYYCVSRQEANIRYENIEVIKKLNTKPNDARVIIKLKDYGTISVPYEQNKFTFEYRVDF